MLTFERVSAFIGVRRSVTPVQEVGQVDVASMVLQSLSVRQRSASRQALEVACVKKSGASRVLFVFLEDGVEQRLVAILQRLQDTVERLAYTESYT